MTRENRDFPSNDHRKNRCPPLGRGGGKKSVLNACLILLFFLVLDEVCVDGFVCSNGYGFVDRVRTGRQSGDKNERHLILGQSSGAFLSYLVTFI